MKYFSLLFFLLIGFAINSSAQPPVTDTHQASSIFALDYSSGQELPAATDQAILFKDALIDLVSNTNYSKMQVTRGIPGRKTFVITQLDPQSSGNAYQLILQNKFLNQISTLYTFVYNVDQNTLSFFDPQTQTYVPVPIQGFNVNNLNNCYTYGRFNVRQQGADQNQPVAAIDAQPAPDAPVDTNVTASEAPPAMPDYAQPACPVDGYLWQPGFWSYNLANGGYYWVPGAWVAPPQPGLLWTPPYWGFDGGIYAYHPGYWGATVGFYGGVYYGYGYAGRGFVGGNWEGGHFRYNTAVVRVNTVVIHNTYVDNTVVFHGQVNRAAFNGAGGVAAKPNPQELAAANEHHVIATPEQNRNQQLARADKTNFAKVNGGRPANAAVARVPAQRPGQVGNRRPQANTKPVRPVRERQAPSKDQKQ